MDRQVPHNWLVEPSHLVAQRQSILVARTLCQQTQAETSVPVEVYNPTDEPVQLYKNTSLGLLTPIQELTDVQLDTVNESSKVVGQVKMKVKPEERLPEEVQK